MGNWEEIFRQAKTPSGIIVLALILSAGLAHYFFSKSTDKIRLIVFIIFMFCGMVAFFVVSKIETRNPIVTAKTMQSSNQENFCVIASCYDIYEAYNEYEKANNKLKNNILNLKAAIYRTTRGKVPYAVTIGDGLKGDTAKSYVDFAKRENIGRNTQYATPNTGWVKVK